MNQDLISRKWLIECVEEGWIKFDTEKDKNIFIHLVRDTAPSVQPQRWIPVSEALPKDDEEVIVTCLDDSGDTPFSYTTVAWHYKGMWVCENERCPFVVAWMPLPTSYKEDEDARN